MSSCSITRIAVSYAPAIAAAALCLAAPAKAGDSTLFHDTSAIDRLVAQFTGQPSGTAGGARALVDPRLRLKACSQSLALDWYGTPGRSISIRCPQAGGWRIFVNVIAMPMAAAHIPVIRRGESVTIAIRGAGFSIQRQGEAQDSGQVGEWIAVRTDRRSEPLRARIERPGLVVVPLG